MSSSTAALLQLERQPNQHSDLSDTHFVKAQKPCKVTEIRWFLSAVSASTPGSADPTTNTIRNLVFQFDVSNKSGPEHNKVVPVKFCIKFSS